jgi:hypothetical protein
VPSTRKSSSMGERGSRPQRHGERFRPFTTTVTGLPDEVLTLLTQPDAIARWTPVPFRAHRPRRRSLGERHPRASSRTLSQTLAGVDLEVLAADDNRVALVATGPFSIDVEYRLRPTPRGGNVSASVPRPRSASWSPARTGFVYAELDASPAPTTPTRRDEWSGVNCSVRRDRRSTRRSAPGHQGRGRGVLG